MELIAMSMGHTALHTHCNAITKKKHFNVIKYFFFAVLKEENVSLISFTMLYNWMMDYLNERSFKVRIDTCLSKTESSKQVFLKGPFLV